MVLITIVTGAYKPTYNWGASHCTVSKGFEVMHAICLQEKMSASPWQLYGFVSFFHCKLKSSRFGNVA